MLDRNTIPDTQCPFVIPDSGGITVYPWQHGQGGLFNAQNSKEVAKTLADTNLIAVDSLFGTLFMSGESLSGNIQNAKTVTPRFARDTSGPYNDLLNNINPDTQIFAADSFSFWASGGIDLNQVDTTILRYLGGGALSTALGVLSFFRSEGTRPQANSTLLDRRTFLLRSLGSALILSGAVGGFIGSQAALKRLQHNWTLDREYQRVAACDFADPAVEIDSGEVGFRNGLMTYKMKQTLAQTPLEPVGSAQLWGYSHLDVPRISFTMPINELREQTNQTFRQQLDRILQLFRESGDTEEYLGNLTSLSTYLLALCSGTICSIKQFTNGVLLDPSQFFVFPELLSLTGIDSTNFSNETDSKGSSNLINQAIVISKFVSDKASQLLAQSEQ